MVQITGRCGRDTLGKAEGRRVAHLESSGVIQGVQLLFDGRDDPGVAMTKAAAPQPGKRIVNTVAFGSGEIRAFCAGDDAPRMILLEIAIVGEGHPQGFQVQILFAMWIKQVLLRLSHGASLYR